VPSRKPNATLWATPHVLGKALALLFVIEVHEEAERPEATHLGPQNVPASRAGNHHIPIANHTVAPASCTVWRNPATHFDTFMGGAPWSEVDKASICGFMSNLIWCPLLLSLSPPITPKSGHQFPTSRTLDQSHPMRQCPQSRACALP
jgi:hypothetical protein